MLKQPIPFPGKFSRRAEVAHLEAEQSVLAVRLRENQLIRGLMLALIESRSARARLNLAHLFASKMRALVAATMTRYATGRGNLSDAANAKVKQSFFLEKGARFRGLYSARQHDLAYFLWPEKSAAEKGDLEQTARHLESQGQLGKALEGLRLRTMKPFQAEDSSLELAIARLAEQKSGSERSLSSYDYFPDLAVFGGYRSNDAQGRAYQLRQMQDREYTVGVSVSLPLWSGLFNHRQVNARKASEAALKAEKTNLRAQIEARYQALQSEYEANAKSLGIYKNILIPQGSAALNSSQLAYETGQTEFITVARAWEDLFALQMGAIDQEALRDSNLVELALLADRLYDRKFQSGKKP